MSRNSIRRMLGNFATTTPIRIQFCLDGILFCYDRRDISAIPQLAVDATTLHGKPVLYNSSVHIPRPVTATDKDWNQLPWLFTEENIARTNWHERGLDVDEYRQDTMKRLYRMASKVDDRCGGSHYCRVKSAGRVQ